jgi:2-polyprenyl-6-methoxyphenol hydroxylase-like FAD-dependent oxidoreductase
VAYTARSSCADYRQDLRTGDDLTRACGQARTLELYDQIGLADAVVERGRKAVAANLWVSGKKEGHIVFGDMGKGLSPFPYAVIRAVAYPFVERVVRGMHPRARIGFIAVDVVARILDVSFG